MDEQKFNAQLSYLDKLIQLKDQKYIICNNEFEYYARLKRVMNAIEKTLIEDENREVIPLTDSSKAIKLMSDAINKYKNNDDKWDFKLDSASNVPRIFHNGKELTIDNGYGIVDFKVHWHTNGIYEVPTVWEVVIQDIENGKENHLSITGNKDDSTSLIEFMKNI